jgi:hypothetical protein
MYDTTKTCVGSPWPDASVGTHGEYERGFLLPQLMGALANEIGGIGLRDLSQRPTNRALFLTLCVSLTRTLKRRKPHSNLERV